MPMNLDIHLTGSTGGIVGLLHDIDFELYPDEHCLKAPELLKAGGVSDDIIHSVCSHGYGITVGNGTTIDVEPVHEMEKEAINKNPGLKSKFDDIQLSQINKGKTPEGFVWHHDAETGKMQLFDRNIHEATGHTGGRTIWGGGQDAR